MTTRYRRKITQAEGIVWDGQPSTLDDLAAWGASVTPSGTSNTDVMLYVAKGNARVTVHLGDVVMAEPDGSGFYPVAADVLRATYEAIGDDHDDEAEPKFMVPDQLTPLLATITLRRIGWRSWNPMTAQHVVEVNRPVEADSVPLYVVEGMS